MATKPTQVKAFPKPTKAPKGLRLREGNVTQFFNACPWNSWWEEFLTSKTKRNTFTYKTAYGFAKAKAKSSAELEIIFRAIGPKQVDFIRTSDNAQLSRPVAKKVPYLGDWLKIRSMAYFSERDSAAALKKACAERLEGLEAGRAAATVVGDLIERWLTYDDKIDEVYDGTPVVEGLNPAQQERRAKLFFKWKRQTMRSVLTLVDKYLACHGITSSGLNDLGQIVTAAGNAAVKQALAGAVVGGSLAGADSPAIAMLSRAIYEKGRIFNMGPPAAMSDEVVAEHEEVHK